jgi:hypothetical protein
MLLGDLIETAGALIKFGINYIGSSLSQNLLRALNALRCAVTNLGTNSWNLIAAAYWTLVGVGQKDTAHEYLDLGYEHICTCQEDAIEIMKSFGGGEEEEGQKKNDFACSESGSVKKANAEEDKKKRD